MGKLTMLNNKLNNQKIHIYVSFGNTGSFGSNDMEQPLYSKEPEGSHNGVEGVYKGATAIIDNSISHPFSKLKLFIRVQNPKEFFRYFDF